jgi:hypothetical protein
MIVGTANGRRNPQGLGVHASLLSIGRAAMLGITTEEAVFRPQIDSALLKPHPSGFGLRRPLPRAPFLGPITQISFQPPIRICEICVNLRIVCI